MRKAPTAAARDRLSNPIVASATLMVDIHEDGTVHSVLGRMDMSTRRYTFVRADLDAPEAYKPGQLPLAIYHVAERCWRDFVDAPFRT